MENQRKDARICQELYEQSYSQSIDVEITLSSLMSIENGVVQGAVLSVTLFLVAMVTICKKIEEPIKILGYEMDEWLI
jgi:hypothetical protein